MSCVEEKSYNSDPGSMKARFQQFKERISDWAERIHRRGRQRLTIMIIPHTEKRVLNLHVNVYTLSGAGLLLLGVLFFSVFRLADKTGDDIQYYDMGLTNSQFSAQSNRMADELIPLHELISKYVSTIEQLYINLDGPNTEELTGGGVSSDAIETLRSRVRECKDRKDGCSQEDTDEILRQVLYLAKQDNLRLERSIALSERIIEELKSPEKQNILRQTPGLWPARGYLLHPYGNQVDTLQGRELFKQGIEIGVLPGTEVIAAAPGLVTQLGYNDTYGLHMWVSHRYGFKTFYAHLDRTRVQLRDLVDRGQVIAYTGSTGNVRTPMLYYEIHIGTIPYNPHAFINHLQDQWLIQKTL